MLSQFRNPRLQSRNRAFGLFQFVLEAALLGEQDLLPFGEIGDVVFALECRKNPIRGAELIGHAVLLGFDDRSLQIIEQLATKREVVCFK